MKYEETYPGIQAELTELIRKTVPDTFSASLREAGVNFGLPTDKELELKIKYDVDENGGSLTLKVLWDNSVEEEEEDEEDEDKEDD